MASDTVATVVVDACGIWLPHCGQNIACWRTDAPHAEQRCAISGSDMMLNPVHGVEEIFSLSVDAYAEVLPFTAQPIFQGLRTLTRPRRVGYNHHRKLSLDHGLVDVDDTATRVSEDLRYTGHNTRMVQPKN